MYKDIKNYEGYYQINENGEVKSVDRTIVKKNGLCTLKGRMLSSNISTNGYKYVILSKNGVSKTSYIHRMVAETFLEEEHDGLEVNHINGIKTDNRLENLEWLDRHTNASLGSKGRTFNHKYGKNPKAKSIICTTTGEVFGCIKEFAERYNINYSTIRLKIRQGVRNFNGYGIDFAENI